MPVWPFKKSGYVNGYTNNPHWQEPEFTDRHSPCGYWPVGTTSTQTLLTGGMVSASGHGGGSRMGNSPPGTVGDDLNRVYFDEITRDGLYKKIAAGSDVSFVIDTDDNMWGIGLNSEGELGIGDNLQKEEWVQIPGSWKDVSSSRHYSWTVAIKTDGTMWSAGENSKGQLAQGDSVDRNVFTQIGSQTDWNQVETGSFYFAAVKDNGSVHSCGDNQQGCLGISGGASYDVMTATSKSSGIASVSCGYQYTGLLGTDGKVFMAGANTRGQYGDGTQVSQTEFKEITEAGTDNVFLSCNQPGGTVWMGTTFLIKSNGTMYAAGNNEFNLMGIPDTSFKVNYSLIPGEDWLECVCQNYTTVGVKSSGEAWGVGQNDSGNLGLGDELPRTDFEKIGSDLWAHVEIAQLHTIMISSPGYAWG